MSKSSGGGLSREDTKQDHPLQAIVCCDAWSDQSRWGPIVRRPQTDDEEFEDLPVGGQQRPWCLLPMLNVPLLAWTLESLAQSGVEQVFLFAKDGADEIRQYLTTTSFHGPEQPLSIIVRPTKALTPGDVMREVDGLSILSPADYLVVQAGYVGNVDLKKKVEEFTGRRLKDQSLAMSCIVAPIQTKTSSTFSVHALSTNSQLYHYEQSPLFPKMKTFKVPRECLKGGEEVVTRCDLESVGAVICSVEVAPLFTENFDYQCFYPDFVNGLLTSDLLGKTICCTIIGEDGHSSGSGEKMMNVGGGWAGVVGNTKSYDVISKALLSRKAYPLVPDENLPSSLPRYEQRRSRVYYGPHQVSLSRTCKINSMSMIGSNSTIGSNTFVSKSVLGENVETEGGVRVENSYIFEGTRLGQGSIVKDSIVGEGCKISKGVVVEEGSLIAAGVVLGEGAKVKGMRVSLEEYQGDRVVECGESNVGEDGIGYFWPNEDTGNEDGDEDDDEIVDPRNLSVTRLGQSLGNIHLNSSQSSLSSFSRHGSSSSLSSMASHSDDDDSDDESTASTSGMMPTIAGLDVLESDVAGGGSSSTKHSEFVTECLHSLDRSFQENHTVDNAAIELKTLRMASNVDLGQVRQVVVPYVLERCNGSVGASETIERWGGLISNLTGDSEEAMMDSLSIAQQHIAEKGQGDLRFWLRVLKGFYEEDVVTDDAVFSWYKSLRARTTGGEVGKALWTGSRPFLEALQEDDEDSDEDEEEEDSD